MSLLQRPHSFVSGFIARLGQAFGWQLLPTRFDGRWLRLPTKDWARLVVNYEPYIAAVMEQHLKRGDTVLDIGAHVGVWSAYAAHIVGKSGKVIACEPSPAFEQLVHTARGCRQIRPLKIGIGAENGPALFHSQELASSASFVRNVTDINVHFLPDVPVTEDLVAVRTLDSLINELDVAPTLIKVDVEGFELEVLRGTKKTLNRLSSVWIIEVHPPQLQMSGGSEAELHSTLERSGYCLEIVNRNPNSLYTLVATKNRACF